MGLETPPAEWFRRLGIFNTVQGPVGAYPFSQLFRKNYLKLCLRFFARQNAWCEGNSRGFTFIFISNSLTEEIVP